MRSVLMRTLPVRCFAAHSDDINGGNDDDEQPQQMAKVQVYV